VVRQVVFSDVWWVGSKEDNPEEKKLKMPADLGGEQKHSAYDYDYGARMPRGAGPAACQG
jgi:hypothetical protein